MLMEKSRCCFPQPCHGTAAQPEAPGRQEQRAEAALRRTQGKPASPAGESQELLAPFPRAAVSLSHNYGQGSFFSALCCRHKV